MYLVPMFTVCGMLKGSLFTVRSPLEAFSPARRNIRVAKRGAARARRTCRSPWCGRSRQLGRCPTCRCPIRRLRFLQRSSPRCLTEGLSGRGLLLRPARCGHRKLRKQLSKKLKRLLGAAPDPGADGTANEGSIRPGTRETTHQQRAKGCSKRRCQTAAPTWSRIAKGPTQR